MSAPELALGINDRLKMSAADVARLTRSQRENRVRELITEAHDILTEAIGKHITDDGRTAAAICVMFSGGDDSTVLTHLFRNSVDYAVHANTGIGIRGTRTFVRDTCEEWGLSLIERTAPRVEDHYENLVLTRERGSKGQALGGFPGPAMHFKTYARLKERVFRLVRSELITNSRQERVVYIAGRRRSESERRKNVPKFEVRENTILWVSPLVNWTKPDLNTYRLMHPGIPRNRASATIHMSGECLCGAMASPGERDEINYWFPEDFAEQIAPLEAALVDRDDIPEHRKTWGWGADPVKKAAEAEYLAQFEVETEDLKEPYLCAACDDRYQAAFDFGGAA